MRTLNLKTSNPLHQVSNADFKRICNGLNRKQGRILHSTLNTAQKSAVNVGFGSESFLGQLPLQPHFPNLLSELFRNVMAHRLECGLNATALAVGYTQQQA